MRIYGDMYKNMYGQLYNNIKSEILASLHGQNDLIGLCPSENKFSKRIKSKNTKKTQTEEEVRTLSDDDEEEARTLSNDEDEDDE